jgi:hypothetical protein
MSFPGFPGSEDPRSPRQRAFGARRQRAVGPATPLWDRAQGPPDSPGWRRNASPKAPSSLRSAGALRKAGAGLGSAAAEGRRPGDAALGSRSGTTGFARLAVGCLSESAVVAALCRRTPKDAGGPWEWGGRGPKGCRRRFGRRDWGVCVPGVGRRRGPAPLNGCTAGTAVLRAVGGNDRSAGGCDRWCGNGTKAEASFRTPGLRPLARPERISVGAVRPVAWTWGRRFATRHPGEIVGSGTGTGSTVEARRGFSTLTTWGVRR